VLRTTSELAATALVGGVASAQDTEATTEGEETTTGGQAADRPLVVTCRLDNSVVLLNQETKEIFAEIPVGEKPLYCAVSTDGELAYAPNTASSDVSVVNIERQEELKRIPVEASPRGVNVHPETEDAFVEVAGANQVAVIDNESLDSRDHRRGQSAAQHRLRRGRGVRLRHE
jgi:DNA-binding beta-propeller fold protein YncE